MSASNVEVKVPVEQKRIRGANVHSVISQIVEEYNSSNGWSLAKVVPMGVLSLDVYLERSSKQNPDLVDKLEVKPEVKAKTVAKQPAVKVAPKSTTKAK